MEDPTRKDALRAEGEGSDEAKPRLEIYDEAYPKILPVREESRADQILRSIAASFSPADAIAVRAALVIAAKNWRIESELMYGSFGREALSDLIGVKIDVTK